MFFGFSKNNIKYVHLINSTITLKLIEPEYDLQEVTYTFDTLGNAYINFSILVDKYELVESERINMYIVKK